MSHRKDMHGLRFGKLSVIEYAGNHLRGGRPRACWKCICDCGAEKVIDGNALRTGNTKSCGCVQKENTSGVNSPWYTCGKDTAYYNRIRKEAGPRGLSFTLTESEVNRVKVHNCFYCDSPPTKDRRGVLRNGIDRMDNLVGYEVDNVVACCRTCNVMKSALGIVEFLAHIMKISRHMNGAKLG